MSRFLYLLLCLAPLAGCTTAPAGDDLGSVDSETMSEADRALLFFVNDRFTTVAVLDESCGLYRNAAVNLIGRRDGVDGVADSGDELYFRTVSEIDGVSQVGPSAMNRLRACSTARGYSGAGLELTDAWFEQVLREADDGLIAAYAESVCTPVAGAVGACLAPCIAGVTADGSKWFSETVSQWLGNWYLGGGAMVNEAGAALEGAIAAVDLYWTMPSGSARNHFIGCAESL